MGTGVPLMRLPAAIKVVAASLITDAMKVHTIKPAVKYGRYCVTFMPKNCP